MPGCWLLVAVFWSFCIPGLGGPSALGGGGTAEGGGEFPRIDRIDLARPPGSALLKLPPRPEALGAAWSLSGAVPTAENPKKPEPESQFDVR